MYAIEHKNRVATWWTGKRWTTWQFRRLETEKRSEILSDFFRARRSVGDGENSAVRIVRTDV
jgi:hypothetical protein